MAQTCIPNYNVMGLAKASLEANVRHMANAMVPEGVRVNAISAVQSVPWRPPESRFPENAGTLRSGYPIRRTVTIEDVGLCGIPCALTFPQESPVKWFTLTAASTSLQ
ncbi:SDR family oxidoreductase [Shigella flexneri]